VTVAALSKAVVNLEYLRRLYDIDAKLFKRSDTQQKKSLGYQGTTEKGDSGTDPFKVIMAVSEERKKRITSLTTLLQSDLKPRVHGLQRSFTPTVYNLGPQIAQFESALNRLETTLLSSSSYEHGITRRRGLDMISYVRDKVDALQRVDDLYSDHLSRAPFSPGNVANLVAPPALAVDPCSTQLISEEQLESCIRETTSATAILQNHLRQALAEGRDLLASYKSAPLIRERITPAVEKYTRHITELEAAVSGPLLTWLTSLDSATPTERIVRGAHDRSSL
jgi:hypothetical protein